MHKKPDFGPQVDGKSSVYVNSGEYHAYLDRDAAVSLLYDLYWLARCQSFGEEVSLYSDRQNTILTRGKLIGYCEFNLVPSHPQKKHGKNILKAAKPMRHKPHGVYSSESNRLDYFVSEDELDTACEILTLLLQNTEGKHAPLVATLFGTLVVHLI